MKLPMKITPKKIQKLLLIIGVILVILYIWEYYCTTRPVGECGSVCEDRSILLKYERGQMLYMHTCTPWYRWFLK